MEYRECSCGCGLRVNEVGEFVATKELDDVLGTSAKERGTQLDNPNPPSLE